MSHTKHFIREGEQGEIKTPRWSCFLLGSTQGLCKSMSTKHQRHIRAEGAIAPARDLATLLKRMSPPPGAWNVVASDPLSGTFPSTAFPALHLTQPKAQPPSRAKALAAHRAIIKHPRVACRQVALRRKAWLSESPGCGTASEG